MEKEAIRGKRQARKLALQALYQWQMSGNDLYEIEAQFRVANNMDKVDVGYFCEILQGVPENIQEIEASFTPWIDREIQSLNPIELTVLRLGTFELLYKHEVPYKVVLDEAISLTRVFGSQDGHKYVNGVLNQVAQKARKVEIDLDRAS